MNKNSILKQHFQVLTKFEVLPLGDSYMACVCEVWEDRGVTNRRILKKKVRKTREEANSLLPKMRKEFWDRDWETQAM